MKPTHIRPTFSGVVALLAVLMLVTGGTAYAAKQITGKQIKNNTVTTKDIKTDTLKAVDIAANGVGASELAANSVSSADIVDATITSGDVADGSLTGTDVADNSIESADVAPLDGDLDIIDNTITTFDIATDAIDSDEVVDFGLTNQDVGVLFAQIAADGTVDGSSGGVTVTVLGTGVKEVDFGRNISSCAFTATQGEAGVGGAGGAILGVTDRAGNAEAVFVTTRDAANATTNTAFQLVVVC